MVTDSSVVAGDDARGRGGLSDLFGRGMAYVLIWSMQLVVSTLVSPILAHALPAEQFGGLAAAIALYQLLIVVAVFGLDQALEMRRVDEHDPQAPLSRGLLASGILLGWSFVGVVGLTSGLWAQALGFRQDNPLVLTTLLWTAPGAAVLLILGILQAEDRLGPFALVSFFSTTSALIFGLIFIFTLDRSAYMYAWGGVIGQSIACVVGLILTRPRWRGVWQPQVLRAGLALGIPLVLAGLAQFILTAADRFLVQRWLGSVEVARYQVAFTVGNAISLLLLFVNRAWLPRLKAIPSAGARLQAVRRARDGIFQLLAWAVLGVTISAPVLLRIVAPASYHVDSLVPVVFVIALGALPLASIAASTQVLITEDTSRPLIIGAIVAVLVKILMTFLGLFWLGLVGAALGTTVAVLAQAWVLGWIVNRRHSRGGIIMRTSVLVAFSILAAAISTVLPQEGWWFWGRFTISTLCLVPFYLAWGRLRAPIPIGGKNQAS